MDAEACLNNLGSPISLLMLAYSYMLLVGPLLVRSYSKHRGMGMPCFNLIFFIKHP
jgi:hypothetical protein